MLVIRKTQMDAFLESRLQDLVARAVRHLQESLPAAYEALGEDSVRSAARKSIERCRAYEITRECDVFRYFNLMIVLGFDFDTDSTHAWAARILRNPKLDGASKLNRLNWESQQILRSS